MRARADGTAVKITSGMLPTPAACDVQNHIMGWAVATTSNEAVVGVYVSRGAGRLSRRERRGAAGAGGAGGGSKIDGVEASAVLQRAAAAAFGDGRLLRRVLGASISEKAGALGGRGVEGNAAVCLTCQLEADPRSARKRAGSWGGKAGDAGVIRLYETRDPYDRAHAVTTYGMSGERELVPAGQIAWRRSNSGRPERCAVARPGLSAKPRKYPASSMLASGVSIDSAFDWLHEARQRLARAGIAGFGGADGGGERVDPWELSTELRLRDIVHGRTRLAPR